LSRRPVRRIYFAFDYTKDAWRRTTFLDQAETLAECEIIDVSLPRAVHDSRWQREAQSRIRSSDLVIVLLGEDTHSAPGVLDEISLAGQENRPVVQLMPKSRNYGTIGKTSRLCKYSWRYINQILDSPPAG
jgi:hypothetical protein